MTDTYLMPTYARQNISFVSGEGVWLTDTAGNAYLDAISGIGVCNLGHSHPAVTRAIQQQAAQLIHTSNLYRIPAQEKLAEQLCQISGSEKVFFSNSGAEANEAAIKLARLYGHRKGIESPVIVVMENAFHGRTMATLTATGNVRAQQGFEPLLPGFIRVPWNDVAALETLIDNTSICAVFLEPLQGEGGVRVADTGYLSAVKHLCEQQQWLMMLDEVQTGNGRTGDYFACMTEHVAADVITTAKGLGNGFPIGACLARGAAADVFGPGNHGSTYGGNPLACSVAAEVVETLTNEVIPAVNAKGDRLRTKLAHVLDGYPLLDEIRGRGLMTGIQLTTDCAAVVVLARENGLLVNVTAGNVVRLLPPLIITDDEIDTLCQQLGKTLDQFARQQEAS